jgi:hypothetical protein
VDTATLTIAADDVSLAATGRIRCKTSDKAFIRSHGSARISVTAKADLSTCAVADVTVTLDQFGGVASVMDGNAGFVERPLADALGRYIAQACRDLQD